jgi:hypothetical protein
MQVYCLKTKVVSMHAKKEYEGVKAWLNSFLTPTLDGGKWSASRPGHFTPVESAPPIPFNRRLGGPQKRSGRYGEENNPLPLPGIEPRFLGRPAHSLVTIPTALPQLPGL